MIAASPIGPAPTMATVSPGWTCPLSTPTSYAVGRMSASMRISSSFDAVGDGVGGGVGEGHPHEFGLGAVDHVAENPSATAEALAVAALAAVAARAARRDARHEHAVADCDVLHAGADLFDGSDGFVAEDAPGGDLGHVTFQNMKVRSTDRRDVDAHDGVGVLHEDGIGDFRPGL